MTTTTMQPTEGIILSTGVYDLLKDQIRRRKLSKFNEAKLERELKSATQVLRRDLPADVVTADTRVTVKDLESGAETTYKLVGPEKARRKNNTMSILSPIAVAMLGYSAGSQVQWEMEDGIRNYQIVEVAPL
ncbi:regulator of nucleoside diphosphate kinase [Arcticibacter pallidicorallinus]|uniref:Regulator of nucleoside diphosphate kinase n=1 Tax=Arcticibacter pallidicorallinus TaxID=1259464 RepID=A0A2T0U4M0_9SPHI|nr:GreA/GreB family elongation factor [Arcticibacter pallidicorallinus]PRY52840.1 regulator of nucleoside diphosphate kinase [Arcticibacter pallidicorallinus]